jgi:hypothetical protein
MNFKREGVVLRYAFQRVSSAAFDADAAAGGEADDEATVWAFARLDAPAVVWVAWACFAAELDVLGPAITFFFVVELE